MKIYKWSIACLGITCALSIIIVYSGISFGESKIDELLIGVFSSSVITLIYSIISYFYEKHELQSEISRAFVLAIMSLNMSSKLSSNKIEYYLNKYNEWKSYKLQFFRLSNKYLPFFYCGKSKDIKNTRELFESISQKIDKKDFTITSAPLTDEETLIAEFSEIKEILKEELEKINKYMEMHYPGSAIRIK